MKRWAIAGDKQWLVHIHGYDCLVPALTKEQVLEIKTIANQPVWINQDSIRYWRDGLVKGFKFHFIEGEHK